MNITHFLKTYEKIAKQEAFEKEIDDLFLDLSSRVTGTSLEGKFEHCSDRLEKVIAIDAVAHAMHDNSRIALLLYPSAGYTEIKKKLDELSGLEAVNEVRKLNRNYFTSLLSDSEITIISKQVGITKANDIREVIKEYTALFNAEKEAGGPEMISDAELLTLSRYTKDKKYYDYWKNREREEEPLIVAGYASVEVIDKENHLITTSALRDAWDKFIKSFRTRNQQLAHSSIQVGWPLRAYINKAGEVFKSGVDDKGLYVISEIRPDIAIAQRMRKEVENGNIRSFSIAGTATDKQYKSMGGKSVMVVDGLDLAEITFCLPGREKIWTTKGLKPISDIQVGELVLTHNLNWKSVVHTMKRQVNEKLVKIATKYGTLTATSNHKIRKMVYGGKHIEAHYDWVPIKEIKVNDLISYNFPIGFGKYCEPRILSVEEVPFEGIVYNLEVEGDNSYTTEFAVVHNCESPVNQKAYFDIIKSEEIKKDENELEIVREEQLNELFDVPIRISDYTVVVVGGIIRKGSSEHDLDILIRASKDSFLGRAIRLRMSRLLKERNPEILKKTRFIYEPEGPHGSFKPLFYLSLQPINVGNIELSEDSKKELKKDVTSQQKVVLNTLRGYKVIKEHDDGDLTVESADVKYIISTDGRIFKEIGPLVQSSYSGHKLTKIIHKDGAKQEALVQLKELLKEREGGK